MAATPGPAHENLTARYRECVAKLGLDPQEHSILFHRTDDGARHYERVGNGWDAVVTERGSELEREHLTDDDEALYRLTRDTTFSMAVSYELANRIEGQDSRRIMFAHELELMGKVSREWRARLKAEHDAILSKHPYHDDLPTPPKQDDATSSLRQRAAIVLGLLLVIIAAHYPLWASWHRAERLADEGVVARGTIIDRSISYPKTGRTYHLEYAYEVGGERYTSRETVENYIYDRGEAGDGISVWHLPSDPATASVSPGYSFAVLTVWYTVIDLLLLLTAGGALWKFVRRGPKARANQETES